MTVWVSRKREMTGQQPASLPVSEDRTLVRHLLEAYHLKTLVLTLRNADCRHWTRENLSRWLAGISSRQALLTAEIEALRRMLPFPPAHHPNYAFRFIDLFAGIGGIRKGFYDNGGQCVFTSEWNKHAVRTYKANWYCDPHRHIFNQDIRSVTLSDQPQVSEQQACQYIDQQIPDHEVLLAGFPCQPFSLAGVSKKNSLGGTHGFECTAQGNLFFDIARIIAAKTPAIFVLENVKNLKSHDNGNTFAIIMRTLDELGYQVADAENAGHCDPKVIDGKHFLPQHRERIVLVGFRRDLELHHGFTLRDIARFFPATRPEVAQLLEKRVDDKYILSPKLCAYLYSYGKKHQQKGNGFGFGLVSPDRPGVTTRTLSARYYKDGSEILIDRGGNAASGESDFSHPKDQTLRPRRLTPRECARLMGFETPGDAPFIIPVSDTQAYRQFGNSVAVPVFSAVAKLLKPAILKAVSLTADPRTSDKNG